MKSTTEMRIEDLKNLKENFKSNIKAFEAEIVNLNKRISEIEEEIQILEDK
jgi:prefoldin subunit 5